MYVYKSLLQIVYRRYEPGPGCRSLVIQKYASTTPVQPWVTETSIAFSRMKIWQPYMHAHYKMCVDHIYMYNVPLPGCESLVIQKYECTPPLRPWVRETIRRIKVTAIDVCLQESFTKCVLMLRTSPRLRVLYYPKVCIYNPIPTLSKRNIDRIQ